MNRIIIYPILFLGIASITNAQMNQYLQGIEALKGKDTVKAVDLFKESVKENRDAARYYPEPKEAAANIKDHIAFWKGVQITD